MIKRILKCSLFAFIGFYATKTQAQIDPHFSQYYIYPQWLNPALTGIMDGDYRVAGVYRSQWSNIDNGFTSIGVAAEMATSKDINLGVGLFQQSAGNAGYKYFTPYASVAYTGIKFGSAGNQHISIGINGGVIDRRFDPSKMKFGDQWNQSFGLPTSPTAEVIANPAQTTLDLGAGVLYYDATPFQKMNGFLGLSFSHITQPTDKFLSTANSTVQLPMRQILHGGVKINLSDNVSLTPNFLLMKQGTAHERMIGAYAQIKSGEGFDFLCGANYRFNDAIVPFTGFYYKEFVLGLSYDVNASDLSKIAGSTSSFEISLSYTGKTRRNLSTVPFICPRL
jgi:type IX secretion system PorP/SprF family membrane protein